MNLPPGWVAIPVGDLALLERHAARYNWLRCHGGCPFSEQDDAWDTPMALDAAVDERMNFESVRVRPD